MRTSLYALPPIGLDELVSRAGAGDLVDRLVTGGDGDHHNPNHNPLHSVTRSTSHDARR